MALWQWLCLLWREDAGCEENAVSVGLQGPGVSEEVQSARRKSRVGQASLGYDRDAWCPHRHLPILH